MPGAYDRSRNAAVVRQISTNFEAAVSSFFGTRTPNREVAQGAHDAYCLLYTSPSPRDRG